MKKAFILALFLVPSVAFASFDVDLHYASKGDDVVALQEYLTDQGVYTGPITGNFYSLTLSAVRKYQKTVGITPISGFVGPITRGVINAQLEAVAPDSEGNAVVIEPVVIPTPVPTPVVTPASTPAPQPAPQEVTRVTSPSVSIMVNGVSGTSTVTLNGCIVNFLKTCGHYAVSWSSNDTTDPGCGILGSPNVGFAGNYGTSGSQEGTFTASTTVVTIQCQTANGPIKDKVTVLLQ